MALPQPPGSFCRIAATVLRWTQYALALDDWTNLACVYECGLAILPQFSPQGRGVMIGATVGNGVAVGERVADAPGPGVATCACAPAKKATKPTRTHTQTKAIPDRIRVLMAGWRS